MDGQSQDQDQKTICSSCGAKTFDRATGKCEKCDYTATLEEYGFEIHRMRNKTYILTEKGEADPLSTFSNVTSRIEKKNVATLTKAPLAVVEKAFALLAVEPEKKAEESKSADIKKKGSKKLSSETEARIVLEVKRILEAGNQLEALKPYLDNMIVGEDNTKQSVVVLNLSAKCPQAEKKQIILFKATEGAGKSTLMRKLTLGYKIKDVGRFSAHALDYTDLEGFEILSLKELGSMDNEAQGVSTIKFLSSDDNGYTVEVTIRDEETGRFTTEQHRIPAITTTSSTTRLLLDPQFERRAWIFGLNETPEQTQKIAEWTARQEQQRAEKLLELRELTDEELANEIYSRFIQQFKPKEIIIPFPRTLVNTLSFDVLRVRGDIGKLLTFAKLYAMLNLKRLEKVTEEIYTLTPEVAVEALNLALLPIAGMLSRIDDRTKALFSAMKEIVDIKEVYHSGEEDPIEEEIKYSVKGAEITKTIRERIAVKIGKSEKTIRAYLNQLESSGGYVSSDQKKPKTHTLLYDVEEIEKKISGILAKTQSADILMEEMRKEAQEWIKIRLEKNFLRLGKKFFEQPTIEQPIESSSKNILPVHNKNFSNPDLGVLQADLNKGNEENRQNEKLPTSQEDNGKTATFHYRRHASAETCEYCGDKFVEYEVNDLQNKETLYRCALCFEKLRARFSNATWKELP